ncbi:tetratricopeptide repeat protein [Nitrogeniibacter aestuarii]|uniref:tetratricopeptide repeat protein n=1 Tax=Nitrogeniibacter aestuarii TaxID=2815343 RepID=UPI001E4B5630|nr:tetratricopeptide repeat protein [Nitrogeniibacter aestuarii]
MTQQTTRRLTTASALIGLAATLALGAAPAVAQVGACGSLDNAYGPYDYRLEAYGKIQVVERFHFTPDIEALQRPKNGTVGGNLDYTLRASPNHPRALMTLVRAAMREKTSRVSNMPLPVACYFERAHRFTPDDPMVSTIEATYLQKIGQSAAAREALVKAREQAPNNPNIFYNLGLVSFKLGDYDDALEFAHKAYSKGFPLPGLRNMLKRAGKWTEPPPEPEATATEAEPTEAAVTTPDAPEPPQAD